jgi:hypothetical protein
VSKIVGRVRCARVQPASHLIELGEKATPLPAVVGVTDLACYRQPAEQSSAGRLVVTGDGRKERDSPAGVLIQTARIAEDRRGDGPVDMGVEERHRVVGILVVGRHLIGLA